MVSGAPPTSEVLRAERVDHRLGVRVVAERFGPLGARLIGCAHAPLATTPHAGVVICSSLYGEFLSNYYRREVLLAAALAGQGLAVQRFHYRGTGNSDGRAEEVTFDAMVDDARAGAAHLRTEEGVTDVAFLGTRFGAMIAAAAAADVPNAPVVLWAPVSDGERYFREAFRARMIRELKEGRVDRPSTATMLDELERDGVVDVLGHAIQRALFYSAKGKSLAALLTTGPRPVLLTQIGKSGQLQGDYTELVERWRRAGWPVDTSLVTEDEAWWFVGEEWKAEEQRAGTAALVAQTKEWLVDHLPRSGPSR